MPYVKCKICKTELYVKPNHQKKGWGKYCSKKCQYIGQRKGKFVKCQGCGKEAWKAPRAIAHSQSGSLFCSKSCQTRWRNKFFSGEKHPSWIDGKTIYRKTLLRSGAIQRCGRCMESDTRILAVHHIDRNRGNNKLKNLTWLCHNCHYLIHHDALEMAKFVKSLKGSQKVEID